MSRIKSALELALERSSSVPIDKESVRRDEWIRKGKTLASKFISNQSGESLNDGIKAPGSLEETWLCKGLVDTFLANITLPRHEADISQLDKAGQGLQTLAENRNIETKTLRDLLNQFRSLFRQYLENLKSIEQQVRQQWEPRLRQKEQVLRQQTGQNISLTAEQDPEFGTTLNSELSHLSAQYNEVIQRGKLEIQRILS